MSDLINELREISFVCNNEVPTEWSMYVAQACDTAIAELTEAKAEIERLKEQIANESISYDLAQEVIAERDALREQVRWRKWPEEQPSEEGEYLVTLISLVVTHEVLDWTNPDGWCCNERTKSFIVGWLPIPADEQEGCGDDENCAECMDCGQPLGKLHDTDCPGAESEPMLVAERHCAIEDTGDNDE